MFLIANITMPVSGQRIGAIYSGGSLGFISKEGSFGAEAIEFTDRFTDNYPSVDDAAEALSAALKERVCFNSSDSIIDWIGQKS